MGCDFGEARKFVCKLLGFDSNYKPTDKKHLFDGYFKNFKKSYSDNSTNDLKVYPNDVLEGFWDVANIRFEKDGIDAITQFHFNIMYDLETDRIVVPWKNNNGEIVGIMGRYNDDNCDELGVVKWLPIIPFSKSKLLYGYYENYNNLVSSRIVFIGESEKFTMQLHSFGINNGVSVGGHSISPVQAKYIKSLYPETVIICFDEDVKEDILIKEAKKLLSYNSFLNYKIGYIFDKDNKYLEKGKKQSPSDKGREVFKSLIDECVIWIN